MVCGRSGEEHLRDSRRLFVSEGVLRERKHFGDATLAAVVCENGPVLAAELIPQAGEVPRGRDNGAIGNETIVPHLYRIGGPASYGAIRGTPFRRLDWLPAADHLVARGINDPQSRRAAGCFRELHNALGSGWTLGARIAPTLEISNGRDEWSGDASFQRRFLKDLL